MFDLHNIIFIDTKAWKELSHSCGYTDDEPGLEPKSVPPKVHAVKLRAVGSFRVT